MLPVTDRYAYHKTRESPIRRQFSDKSRAAVSTAEPHAMEEKDWAGPSRPKSIEKVKN